MLGGGAGEQSTGMVCDPHVAEPHCFVYPEPVTVPASLPLATMPRSLYWLV